jgi:putative flippase GtrA
MTELILKQIYKNKIYIKYVISGGTAAGVDLALLFIFTELLNVWYIISATIAFFIAFFVSFTLQKFWTFRDNSTEGVYKQMSLYFAVGIANLFLNAGLMFVLVDIIHLWYMLAQVVAGVFVASWSFLIYKIFIFKNQPSGTSAEK